MSKRINWTPDQVAWIRANRSSYQAAEFTKEFNGLFGTALSKKALMGCSKRLGCKAATNGQFQKSSTPHNKGVKGVHNSPRTEFIKGNRPTSAVPIGTEVRRDEGYLWRKIAEPNQWRQAHHILWEQTDGPIPRGHCLIFLDGDATHIERTNLALVTRSELVRMNKIGYLKHDPDARPTILAICRLQAKISEINKRESL